MRTDVARGFQPSDARPASAIGRDARLELVFERRGGRTAVAHAYAEPPMRVGRTFAIGDAAYLILVCTGPGLFGGDRVRQSIHVGRGARVVLTSQSALQIHPCAPEPWRRRAAPPAVVPPFRLSDLPPCPPAVLPSCPPALYDHRYVIEDDGELHCHWDPVIPFADASLVQQFDINLLSTSRLYWSDALMSGRTSRGERWRFRDVAHRLRLTVDGSLTYLERFTLAAADRDVMHPWMASQADYLGTTIVYHTQATADIADALQRELDAGSAVAGVDLTAPRLLVARLLASRGPSFATARDVLRRSVLARIFHTPQLIGRK